MLDEQVLKDIYEIADKIVKKEPLTEQDQDMYDDILEDAEYYQAFCLYTILMDLPAFYEQAASGDNYLDQIIVESPEKNIRKEKNQSLLEKE